MRAGKRDFSEILLASRTLERCNKIAKDVAELAGRTIQTAEVDADDVEQMRNLIRKFRPDLVINVALPYQDSRSWMRACRTSQLLGYRKLRTT